MKFNIINFLATGFYSGKFPIMPGTIGSLIAYPIFYIVTYYASKTHYISDISSITDLDQEILKVFIIQILFCVFLYFLGVKIVDEYLKTAESEDPKEVVIDEILGQFLTLTLSFLCIIFAYHSDKLKSWSNNKIDFIFLFLLPFILFRFFDAVKPWPINWFDKNIKGAKGVMIDDIVAAIFASLFCYGFTFLII